MMRRFIVSGLIAACVTSGAQAQQKLVGGWEFSAMPTLDRWSLASPLPQPVVADGGGLVRDVEQFSVPIRVRGTLGSRWSIDLASAYARSSVVGDRNGAPLERALSGLSDVRVRATGQLITDRVLLTVGANIPTGRTELDAAELAVARVVGAPALGMSVPVLGLGGGASAGLVFARPVADGRWALAGGVSYEYRARYAPVSLTGGLAAPDFSPSGVVRVSAGLDGLVGAHAMTLNVGADLFAEDRLALGEGSSSNLTSQLGPVFSADWELRLATTRLREATVFLAERYRSAFSRAGVSVTESAGNYLDAGARIGIGAGAHGMFLTSVSARLQSGLGFEAALPTAAARLVVVDLRYVWRDPDGLTIAPFARVQTGTIEQGTVSTGARGLSVGLSLGAAR
jgi:hypothetical protein